MRVLIVDDELSERQLLGVMLAPEGYLLRTATSGAEALAMVAQDPPDLILLDVMMPEMDGYEVAARIRGNFATKNIPVIMITALNDREARILGLSAGAVDFLSKPIDRVELCARVSNLLHLKGYGDYYDKYSQRLEVEVGSRTADFHHERDWAQRCLDTADVILLALDVDGRVTLVNRCACALLGWSEAELMGRDWIETCLPDRIRDLTRGKLRDVVAGDLSVVENPILTREGEERMIEWRNTVLRDDAGRVIGTFSSGTDVTERSQAVEALRTVEVRMRFALETAGVGIWDMDCTTQTVRWSETLEAQYGLAPGKFGGTFAAFKESVHPDDREAVRDTIGKAMKTGSDFSVLNRAVWPDGTVRWLSGAGRFQLGEHGEPVRGVGISQDVTEQRLLERQYQQAQKMEAIGQLASGIAHDFNNMLTVILACTELIGEDAEMTNRHGEELGEIIKAGRRATGLTQQLLAFGRQQVLHAEPLDVNGLITDMTGMLSRLIGEHIEVTLVLEPGLSPALVDRGQLEQVVMNLAVNARDAMPNGGVLTMQTAEVDLANSTFHEELVVPGRYLMLAITDTGNGMSEETKRRLFEPFFTTKAPGKGTGLGLSTTYGIVKQSKGYIRVSSELGLGTTFSVYLPRSVDESPLKVLNDPEPYAALSLLA